MWVFFLCANTVCYLKGDARVKYKIFQVKAFLRNCPSCDGLTPLGVNHFSGDGTSASSGKTPWKGIVTMKGYVEYRYLSTTERRWPVTTKK